MQTNTPREGIIHLDVAVTDNKGKPVLGLTAKDLKLTDNGAPQAIDSFAASNQQPANEDERLTEVVLLLDEVNLSPEQFELVKDKSIRFLRQNGGHLGEPTSVYWFTISGLYATAAPTTDGNALAEDVAQHRYRTVWKTSRVWDPLTEASSNGVTEEAQKTARWEQSLRVVYTIAIEQRNKPGRKLLLCMGFGWVTGDWRSRYREDAFPWLVELSTRMREARMVISEVVARVEPITARTEGFTSR